MAIKQDLEGYYPPAKGRATEQGSHLIRSPMRLGR